MENDNSNGDIGQDENTNGETKKMGTLSLENVSISTLKDDLNKKESEEEEPKGNWFDFISKHTQNQPVQGTAPSQLNQEAVSDQGAMPDQSVENSEVSSQESQTSSNPLDQAIKGTGSGELGTGNGAESLFEKEMESFGEPPANLPVSEETSQAEEPISLQKEEVPPLSSFIPPKPAINDAETEKTSPSELSNKLAEALGQTNEIIKGTGNGERGIRNGAEERADLPQSADTESESKDLLPKITLEEEEEKEAQPDLAELTDKIGSSNNEKKATTEATLVGSISPEKSLVDDMGENGEKKDNPFSSRLEVKKPEEGALLQAVESALNYSASPEFSENREKIAKVSEEKKPENKLGTPSGRSSNSKKKFIFIGGGVAATLVVLTIILVIAFSGGPKQDNTNTNTQGAENENKNTAPITPFPKPEKPKDPIIKPKQILSNVKMLEVSSKEDLASILAKMRESQGVNKMTQLVLMKDEESSMTFHDLSNATSIAIPQKILPDANKKPALMIADFFQGKTIFGIVIPTASSTSQTLENMKNWEPTMVMDLEELWKGIDIDNAKGYFADSRLFENGRFALIDKKSGLSLDYLVEDGYIFITCGKDSMTILKSQFSAVSSQEDSNDNSSNATNDNIDNDNTDYTDTDNENSQENENVR